MIYIKSLPELSLQQLQDLVNITLQTAEPRWSSADLLCLNATSDLLFVAYSEQSAWGYLVAQHVTDEIEIHNLVVDVTKRRQGIGRQLIQALCHYGQQQQVGKVFLEVRSSNKVAQLLYASQGFTGIGVRKQYYQLDNDHKEDAYLLCKTLGLTR